MIFSFLLLPISELIETRFYILEHVYLQVSNVMDTYTSKETKEMCNSTYFTQTFLSKAFFFILEKRVDTRTKDKDCFPHLVHLYSVHRKALR